MSWQSVLVVNNQIMKESAFCHLSFQLYWFQCPLPGVSYFDITAVKHAILFFFFFLRSSFGGIFSPPFKDSLRHNSKTK